MSAAPSPVRPTPWTPPSPLPGEFRGPRVLLRAWRDGDAPGLFEAVNTSRDTLLPWLPWAREAHRSLEQTREWIEHARRCAADALRPEHNAATGFALGVFDAGGGEVLGGTGFNRMNAEAHCAETGYWVRADRRRRGYGTEATAAVLSWGFLPQGLGGWGLRRVHILAAAANAPSCAVPRRLGLREECHVKAERWVEGLGYADAVGWGVLAEEWDCGAQRRRS